MTSYQETLFCLLKEVKKICDNHGIQIYLTEGSCLGAVRHHGFIPWDDDVDIAVMSNRADDFFYYLKKELDCKKYIVEEPFDQIKYPNHTDLSGRIYDTSVVIKSSVYKNDAIEHPWIDVMIIYGMHSNVFKRNLHYYEIIFTKALLKLSNKESIGYNSDKKRGRIERFILYLSQRVNFSIFLNEYKLSGMVKSILNRYDVEKSEYVIAFPSDYRKKEITKKDVYGDGEYSLFEKEIVRIPKQYDCYLKNLYGEYTSIPAHDNRHTHYVEVIRDVKHQRAE